ncbi:type I polyketide synthase [Amycolatopsis sp. cmx-4-61]|uniref:type I polyketide synthase n=1 Tax=Amycolatopsis sp. cmx-4-61 TaxID=2790937 RepID=UPI00397DE5B8
MNFPEPVAIIGMACRFAAGIESPEAFWALLRDGGDTVGDLPADRWEWHAGQSREHAAVVRDVTKRGAFLDNVKEFDADFFDVTPREAALMDPQQRITLELAWEALEHAGIPPRSLGGTDAGVFMGVGADDYGRRLLEDLPRIEAWTGIGSSFCAVANRVSYALDLRGPSMVVDTACSSSLVSIHLAAQALRSGECPVALAGGILVMAGPGLSVVLDAAGATSRDGRSKSFDASADGYGRGEGGGIVVLKLLEDARRDGDRVLAVIRGSAVQQDGKTNGIMAPNGEAQAHLMRRAYQASGIDPSTVGYVEAHGTGTSVGDPLEAGAMSSVFGAGRPADAPCLIGSVKPNVGHLEAGAGVAGVIKTVLALQHGEIPASLNFTTPNPKIPWDTSGLRVVTENTPWPQRGAPRRAGVSGYGYGGTIAHVILEAAPDTGAATAKAKADGTGRPNVLPLSGATEAAVAKYAGRLANWLARHPDTELADVGHTLARRRQHLPFRAAVTADSTAALRAKLAEFAASGTGGVTGRALPETARQDLVWVFSGHGSQWTGMARELLATEPAFAAVIDGIEPIFQAEMAISARATIASDAPQPVDVIQPMIFAVQVALAALWRDRGVHPDAVIGHSVGEIAAAVTAGMLTLEQGARLVCRRSVLLRQVAGRGAMAMVNLPPEEARRRLAGRTDIAVAVAAATGSTVFSGDIEAVQETSEVFAAEGLAVRKVDSDVAFHSPHMDPLLESLAAAAADLPPAPAGIPVYSTALADPRSEAPRDGAYWATNLRGTVRFAEAVAAAAADGYRLFVEVSPHPVVEHSINETLDELGITDAVVTHSLRRNRPERETLLANLGVLHCGGAHVDWAAHWPEGSLADLPTTAWQRKEHWVDDSVGRSFLTEQHDLDSHTLLGGRINVHGVNPAQAWLTYLDRDSRPYPGDHPVRKVEIIPAAVLLNSFLTAAASAKGAWHELSDVALRVPVSVTRPRHLQIVLQDGTFRLSSRIIEDVNAEDGDDKGWVTHTTAAVTAFGGAIRGQRSEARTTEDLPTGYVIDRLATLGVAAMGFPWAVEEIRRGEGTLVVTVDTDPGSDEPPATWAPLLDGALSAASVAFGGPPILRMPAHIHRVTLAERSPSRAKVTVRVVADDTVDVEIADLDGTVVGRLTRLKYGVLDSEAGAVTSPRQVVHELAWRPAEGVAGAPSGNLVLVGPDSPVLRRVTTGLDALGVAHLVAATPEGLPEGVLGPDHTLLVVPAAGSTGDAAAEGSWLLARTAQRVAATGQTKTARVWCLTEGVRESTEADALAHGPLWGVGRVIGGEHPGLWGGTVDIGRSEADIAGLVEVLRTIRGEDVVVVRDGAASVGRLHRLEGDPARPRLAARPHATYLITGGLGALGLEVAYWLADRGARRIVLAGRRGLPPRARWGELTDEAEIGAVESVVALERLGVTVVPVAVDIADAGDVAAKLSPDALGLPPFRGVVHAAGVLDDRTLGRLDEASLRRVMRPKVEGALNLHHLFEPGSLDFFVLFSSCGQLLGLPGQTSYAAGNAFLDALAAHRRAAGDTGAASYAWTSWRGLGMSTSTAVIDVELAARGTADISVTEAFGAWDLATRHDLGYAVMLRTLPAEPGVRKLALLSELPEEAAAGATAADLVDVPWAGLTGAELSAAVIEEIRKHVAAETGLAASEVDSRRPLIEMGLDSVMTVRIRRGLERRFRFALPATLFWDRPTIEAVAALLTERMAEETGEPE